MRFLPWITTGAVVLLSACSSPSIEQTVAPPPPAWSPVAAAPATAVSPRQNKAGKPRIARGSPGLQCVPYAREQSGIPIRGDAWTWWNSAKGKYERSSRPAVGSVLVVGRTGKNRYGHLAVVTRIVSSREIIVNHANWLNMGQIHLDTPVRDVSPRNDWSQVKFWYIPGNVLGKSTYPVSGFIYPKRKLATSG
jgi:surface antigen